MLYKRINFKEFSDGRGELVPIEIGADNYDISFEVKRCYFISVPTNDDGAIRGKHAHKNLKQVIICLNGSFTLRLLDRFGREEELVLSKKNEGIYIEDLTWRELKNFSENCVILVLASEHYSEEDYIRNFEEFLNYKR
ncbi:FdtA/QdtA family cupin domain-containing protein [Tenacibaculum maritimum]|uniref:sugar 3,4-ketoisomerase n=3 Tax=Tenacibaculum maritimum TaxID=107401 RepID=UPI0012E46A41|nr:FdtA/QdtA family cupin domain-containing protein [Tenacibaculum maritimum]MCD9580441.1 FdtA/QdtA family cupin domain-containing protein [Tenacibaculum maritimum]MCD9635404.1 FdtA/QdtA family cupin domain-containing protein [Tenacibaculum maritimum]CAA0179541.1 Sugar epimerase [Tenacibaculum maritimum]CAA0183856.1 Sugar epimerase [Tenacibaculum maritimum]CAA0230310.1 TDP-4-oxo-6-deoxy-alpha-D-glucose-3, 4-oxoisomerase [Tenacibaculum maritimum]